VIEYRVEARPAWPLRLPRSGAPDGVLQVRGGVLHRLLRVEGERVHVRAAQPSAERVVIGAWASRRDVAEEAVARVRFALGVDDDLRPFWDMARDDALLGPLVRRRPWLRPWRRPEPFEALAWAVTEQLIDFPRAAAIQRAIVRRLGSRCHETGLREPPSAADVAGAAPAALCACDLAPKRALALVRAAREVASGRVDLRAADPVPGWRRLRRIPEIGPWTLAMLALNGQGRFDVAPVGDLNLLKAVARLRSGSPHDRAEIADVEALLAPYAPWRGLAALHLMTATRSALPVAASARAPVARPAARAARRRSALRRAA
jgi:3-methyladenine DNA glycosylase/8-oxoguanine DNA glycosylase